MKRVVRSAAEHIFNNTKSKHAVKVLAMLVVFVTTYMLILPAFTLERDEAVKQGGIDVPGVEQAAKTDDDADAPAVKSSVDEEQKERTEKGTTEAAKDAGGSKQIKTASPVTLQNEENKDYSIAVEGDKAVLSEDMSVSVREIDQSTRKLKKEYDSLYNDALEAVQKAQKKEGLDQPSDFAFAKFYDISLMDGKTEVEPGSSVDVKISFNEELQKELKVKDPDRVRIVHFAVDKDTGEVTPEVLDSETTKVTVENSKVTEATFTTESFSVFAVVYTVDFHYEVDGKKYEYSIKGGEGIGLSELLPTLGVIRDDKDTDVNEVSEFISQIDDAKFSDTSLISISKADSDTTVGNIKNALGLECEYSAEITDEQKETINDKEIKAGDWALISLKAFSTEENLIITMKNGDEFEVKVTDASRLVNRCETLDEVIASDSNATFLIYSSSGNTNRYLKNDGTTTTTPPTTSTLSSYTWSIERYGGGSYYIKSTGNGNYLNLNGNGSSATHICSSTRSTVKLDEVSTRYSIHTSSRELCWASNKYGVRNYRNQPASMNIYYIDSDPSGSGSSEVDGIVLTDAERAELQKWEETLETFNTLSDHNKKAEVYDYDNRVYKIDITADSGITDFYKNVDLGFVLDVSNSMNFPSSLAPLKRANGTDVSINMNPETFNQLLNSSEYKAKYDQQGCFYVISDPGLTSTIYKIYKDGNTWKYRDASSNTTTIYDLTTNTVFKEGYKQPYTIYYADDTTTRFKYLKDSVNYAIEMLNKIVTPTEVDDGTASVRIAYNLFAGSNDEGRTTIRQSDTFKDLRDRGDTIYSLTWSETNPGTKQNEALYDGNHTLYGYSANEFGWDTVHPTDKYVILVTDGAPNGPTMNEVRNAAKNLKNAYPGLKIISIGLSTQDVDGGSKMLSDIADDIGGIHQFYEAEQAKDLEYILLKILRTIMAEGLVRGTITDTIDSAFYPVDAQGNPLSAGVYDSNGQLIPNAQISDYVSGGKATTAHQNEAFYTLEQVGNDWKITWYNQEIGWDDNDPTTGNPWTGTVYVKAKEDYLGGNLIETNDGNAQIEPTGIKLVINGTPESSWRPLENMPKIDLPVPRVNVHNLETKENSTAFTVYKGTTVTPKEQLEALWDNIPIEEVVSESEEGQHKRTTGSSANVGTAGKGETFTLGSLMSEVAPGFNIDSLIDQITSSKASASQDFTYTAYGHESGKITVKVERTVGNQTPAAHTADTVGAPVEQYKVTFTYKPYSEADRMKGKVKDPSDTDHHNGTNGRGAEETGTITSENTHTINVFQKGINITKVDKTNEAQALPGAVFELYRADEAGTDDVSAYNLPAGTYSKVGGDLTTDANGIITIDSVIPDKDTQVTDKTLYQPNIAVGSTSVTSHDTVFYLVEKTPPTKDGATYAKMPGAIKFTMTLTENKGTDSAATLYDWTQTASITATEHQNGSETYLIADSANTTTGTNADVYAFKVKNGRPTDITLIKTDKSNGNSIGGAKFCLLRGSAGVDLTELNITAISGGAVITPEDYDLNGTTIKVITVPEGGVRIAGLADGTYTLQEVTAPEGYVITDSGKTFKTDNGAIKNEDDTAHEDEAADIAFKVENEPGAELPHTGGIGTTIFYILGSILAIGCAVVLISRRRLHRN